jgi:hypothetical protein
MTMNASKWWWLVAAAMAAPLSLACGGDDSGGDGAGGADGAVDPCDPNPCAQPDRTVCTESGDEALCSCDIGYADDGAGGCVETSAPTYDDVAAWVDAYKAAHPGNGGKDWDINDKTPAELEADADARRLLAICGDTGDQRPVIPLLAWEYGGNDHQWIDPQESALVYCVYIPVAPSTPHWSYAPGEDHVVADLYVLFPDMNPCKDMAGAAQVSGCIGDPTNFEILVDIANIDDGHAVGLELSEASTELKLIPPAGGDSIHLHDDL